MQRLSLALLVAAILIIQSALPAKALQDEALYIPVGLSSDGSLLLVTGHNYQGLRLIDINSGQSLKVTDGQNAGYQASLSPDGKAVAYKAFSTQNDILLQLPVIYDLESNKETRLHGWVESCGSPMFIDNDRVAYTAGDRLYLLDREFIALAEYDLGCQVNSLTASDVVNSVAYSCGSGRLTLLDLDSRDTKTLVKKTIEFFNPCFSPDGSKVLLQTVTGQIAVADLKNGRIELVGPGLHPVWVNNHNIAAVQYPSGDLFHEDHSEGSPTKLVFYSLTGEVPRAAQTIADSYRPTYLGKMKAVYYADREFVLFDLTQHGDNSFRIGDRATVAAPNEPKIILNQEALSKQGGPPIASVNLPGAPFIHQIYDAKIGFDGRSACGAAAALMVVQYYNLLPPMVPKGWHMSNIYRYNDVDYSIWANDRSFNRAFGAYGYIAQDTGWYNTPKRGNQHSSAWLSKFLNNHGLTSSVKQDVTWANVVEEIDSGYPVVLLFTNNRTRGHYVTVTGYVQGQKTLIINDPYGDLNTPEWPSNDGYGVLYDWPTDNNGNVNLLNINRMISARGELPDSGALQHKLSLGLLHLGTGTVYGADQYPDGAAVNINARAAEGYEFVSWTEGNNLVSLSARYSFIISSDLILIANFRKKDEHAEPADLISGDINNDGIINVIDVSLLMRHILELENLTPEKQEAADLNNDGIINVIDVSLLLKIACEL